MAPACPVCGTPGPSEPAARLQHVLYRCSRCSVLYSERVGDPELIARYYREGQGQYFELPYFDRHQDLSKHPEYESYLGALKRVKARQPQPGRLLDVGSGTGALLEIGKSLGFDAEGLELSGMGANEGFTVHRYDGDFAHLPAIGPFDVITMWDVIEHLADPAGALVHLKKLLKPGGYLLIRTVDEDCLLATWSMAALRLGFATPARRMHEIYHVVYFTKPTLDLCLKRAGFTPRERWAGEFPVERASRSAIVRAGLRFAYLLQRITGRPFEQYVIASAD